MNRSNSCLFIWLCLFVSLSETVNHWILKENEITQKIDSPFFLREPGNLHLFLEQIRNNDRVEASYMRLLRQHEQIVDHLRFSVQFSEDLVQQAKCAMDFYLMERRMSYLKLSSPYQQRLQLPETLSKAASGGGSLRVLPTAEPHCLVVAEMGTGPCCYNHLESLQPELLRALRIEAESEMTIDGMEPSSVMDYVRRLAVLSLAQQPLSWHSHTLSSYYWRLRGGQAQEAVQCAQLGAMLAPRSFKDIPLLSLGTILFRAGRLADADVLLTAAVEHASEIAENHVALASALAMKHEFNRSLYHFDEAERLDPSLLPRTQPVRDFISCLENLTKKTAKMYSYVEYMKNEVKEFKKLKNQISQSHEKLMQQQVPLSARFLNAETSAEDLLKRGQYCSTRTLSTSEEPVLFCDFYSDMQMRLESKDVDIESLERDLKLTSEAVIRQVSLEFRKQLNFEQLKTAKAQIPTNVGETAEGSEESDIIDIQGKTV